MMLVRCGRRQSVPGAAVDFGVSAWWRGLQLALLRCRDCGGVLGVLSLSSCALLHCLFMGTAAGVQREEGVAARKNNG